MWPLLEFGVSLNPNALATRMVLFKDPMFTINQENLAFSSIYVCINLVLWIQGTQ